MKASLPPSPMYSGYLPRRPSPPCCYERRDSFLCCCYARPAGAAKTSLLAALGVCVLVLAYAAAGAFAFMALEGGARRDDDGVRTLRAKTVERLWSITENLNILYRENWTRLAADEVLVFERSLVEALASGEVTDRRQGRHEWTFGRSFLYSLTLITTIGYGSVSPRTSWGKMATIAYALVGIPLMLLYLSTTGDVLARAFRRLYARACGAHRAPCSCAGGGGVRVPATLCIAIVLAYVAAGALLFNRLEDWTLLEGTYFCFTSLGTIGSGDLAPADASLCAAYILAGMAIVAMCFSLVQDEVIALFRFIGANCSRNELLRRKDEPEGS